MTSVGGCATPKFPYAVRQQTGMAAVRVHGNFAVAHLGHSNGDLDGAPHRVERHARRRLWLEDGHFGHQRQVQETGAVHGITFARST